MGKILSLINNVTNRIEYKFRRDYLLSYPPYFGLNLSTVCNLHCNFCCYEPRKPAHAMVTLDQFKKMKWLKYVKQLCLAAGIGDSLTSPFFLPILKYVVTSYPHLDKHIDLTTNGVGLTTRLAKVFARHLSFINVSVNAGTKETHRKVSGVSSTPFARMFQHIKEISSLREDKLPVIFTSIVLTKENFRELPNLVRISASNGVDRVTACHYVPVGTTAKDLYGIRDEANTVFREAQDIAKNCGMDLYLPAFEGSATRSTDPKLKYCSYLWRTAYLTSLEHGEPEACFCCSGVCIGIPYDRDRLDGFKALWNSPTARYLRRYPHNRLCDFCRIHDRANPEHEVIRKRFIESFGKYAYNNNGVLHIDLPNWLKQELGTK